MKKIIQRNLLFALVCSVFFTSCSSSKSSSNEAKPIPEVSNTESNGPSSKEETASEENSKYTDNQANTEEYLEITENDTNITDENSMITFSLKVDTASYSNVERYILSGNNPPEDAVRVEEMVNYFTYDTKLKETDKPFALYTEIGNSPFDANKKLAFVRVKSKDIDKTDLPKSNLTFLIDTSGSMDSYDKLPLLKDAFALLVETLSEDDKVSIVTYAGSSAVILDGVSGYDKSTILNALDNLFAAGSTAGADGILTAYELAEKNFIRDGNNRLILATDGDFNVGVSSNSALEKLITKKRDTGIYLSILGFGTGNLKDSKMETLSKNGNGNYSYINSIETAKKVLVDELSSNLFTVANDVKTQIEFNPKNIKSYRLIGYENRKMANEDFNDDKKDAGEIGVGTDVVVLFEFELSDTFNSETKYSNSDSKDKFSDELFEIRINYKDPGENESKKIKEAITSEAILENNSSDFNFAKAVASFAHILRNSKYSENLNLDEIIETAYENKGEDKNGYRDGFVNLLQTYKSKIYK